LNETTANRLMSTGNLERPTWLTPAFWLLALGLAAFQTLAAIRTQAMGADGIAYLDIGDAYVRGDWQNAINPVWSPLYSWILGIVMAVVQPPMSREFPLVHLVNLALFVLTFVCFEFFWRELGRYRLMGAGHDEQALPAWVWFGAGYALFIWVTLTLIAIWAVTPDMLMAALVLLAAGIIVRMRRGDRRARWFLLLGLVLGCSYLAKSVMLPLGFVLLAAGWLSAGEMRRTAPRALVGLFAFLLVCLPFIVAVSRSHGSATFGEAGTVTYLRHVRGLTRERLFAGGSALAAPAPPFRQGLPFPPVYAFGERIGGTYPLSYNPAYWYRGAEPAGRSFNLGDQLQALVATTWYYVDLFVRQQGVWLALVGLLYVLGPFRLPSPALRFRRWSLFLAALVGLLLYGLVYVEGRYVGVFVLLLWGDLLANLRLRPQESGSKLVGAIGLFLIVSMLVNTFFSDLQRDWGIAELLGGQSAARATAPTAVQVAQGLQERQIPPGSAVGVIGDGYGSYWARLARVRIVAEMLDEDAAPFWVGDAGTQRGVLEAFRSNGACAIVAEDVPAYASLPGWQQIGRTDYYVYAVPDAC
jgi:hypothetical protein